MFSSDDDDDDDVTVSACSRPPDSHSHFCKYTHCCVLAEFLPGQLDLEIRLEPPANLSSCWAVWGQLSQRRFGCKRCWCEILDQPSGAGSFTFVPSYCRPAVTLQSSKTSSAQEDERSASPAFGRLPRNTGFFRRCEQKET